MSLQIIGAAVAFVALFVAWVIIPSHIRKHHQTKIEETDE
jgi:hypothetical protein